MRRAIVLEGNEHFKRDYRPKISQDSVRRVQESTNIAEVIGAVVELRRAGGGMKAFCPFHKEIAQSFAVSVDRQIFKCFGCGAGGAVIDFVMLYHRIGFDDAVESLAKRSGIHVEYESDYL